jgi:hypothetical protein
MAIRNINSKKKINKSISAVLASLAAALGFSQSAQALVPQDLNSVDKIWEYTQSLNSVDGYRAFIASHADYGVYTREARARAIDLLGDFDLDSAALTSGYVSSPLLDPANSYRVALNSNDTFVPSFGKRQLTFIDVFVDTQGKLIDADGAYIDPQGNKMRSGTYSISTSGQLITPQGDVMIDDVGIVKRSKNDIHPTESAIGRLSIRRRDLDKVTNGSSVVSRQGRVINPAEQRAGLSSAATTGVYGG